MSISQKIVALCLLAVIVSLLIVGVVSSPPTVYRHIVQVIPAVLALGFVCWGVKPWASSAMAIFLVWLPLMVIIWLFLLGIAKVISGTFSTTEIVLTVIIGAASLAGLTAGARSLRGSSWISSSIAFLLVAALQVGAIWLGMRSIFQQG